MTMVIDVPAAIDGLRQAVAERGPNFVYKPPIDNNIGSCTYYDEATQQPGCLVGLALVKLGVPVDVLKALDTGASNGGSLGASALSHRAHQDILGDVLVTTAAAHVLGVAQSNQDRGAAWGLALREAEGYGQRYQPAPVHV